VPEKVQQATRLVVTEHKLLRPGHDAAADNAERRNANCTTKRNDDATSGKYVTSSIWRSSTNQLNRNANDVMENLLQF